MEPTSDFTGDSVLKQTVCEEEDECASKLLEAAEPAGPAVKRPGDSEHHPNEAPLNVDELIQGLGTDEGRLEARRQLLDLGPEVLLKLDAALKNPNEDIRSQANELLRLRAARLGSGDPEKDTLSLPQWQQLLAKTETDNVHAAIPGIDGLPAAIDAFSKLTPEQMQAQIAEFTAMKVLMDRGNFGATLKDARRNLSEMYALQVAGLEKGSALLGEFKILNLNGSCITDLSALPKLTNLTDLRLSSCGNLDDKSLAPLAKMTNLQTLHLRADSLITSAGMDALKDLTKMTDLRLGMTSICDEGMPNLQRMKDLKFVDLGTTRITSKGLASISGASNLEHLDLQHCHHIDDSAVDQLKSYSRLKELNLEDTNISQEGYETLVKALPNTKISWTRTEFPDMPPVNPAKVFHIPQLKFSEPAAAQM